MSYVELTNMTSPLVDLFTHANTITYDMHGLAFYVLILIIIFVWGKYKYDNTQAALSTAFAGIILGIIFKFAGIVPDVVMFTSLLVGAFVIFWVKYATED